MSAAKAVEFSPEMKTRFEKTLAKYEVPASALLPTLYLAQEQFGFLSTEVLEYVAKILNLPSSHAFEAASFYTMFKKKDMGRWCLQVCNNVTCAMMGSEELIKTIKEELGISFNEKTPDNLFSVIPVQCLGSCDTAPVVQVNDDYVESLTPEKLRQHIRKLKGEKPQASQESLHQ
jgi:NADH-quinone oxidoreductase E subunit